MSRQSINRPAVTCIQQADHRIDHGQAGAHQQHRRFRIQSCECRWFPRTAPPKPSHIEGRYVMMQRRRRRIADRQHDNVGTERCAGGHGERHSADPFSGADHVIVQQLQSLRVTLVACAVDQILEIEAIEPTWHEGISVGRIPPSRLGDCCRSQPRKSSGRSGNAPIRPAGTLSRWFGLSELYACRLRSARSARSGQCVSLLDTRIVAKATAACRSIPRR